MFYLVCFDIVDDRTRYRVVKILKEYGYRVQKSVFECSRLSESQLMGMIQSIEERIDHTADSVRYYALCRDCLKKVEVCGIGSQPQTAAFRVF